MQVEKIYRNHRTGEEKIVVVEKPDDVLMRGCAYVQTFDAHGNGDMVEECISPNIITNYVKDQLGRLIFNSLMWGPASAVGGTISASHIVAGLALDQAVPGEANTIKLSSSISSASNGTEYGIYFPFQKMFLSTYSTAEDATEIWVPNTVTPISGSMRYVGWNATADSPVIASSSISTDGNTFTFVWDYTTTDWNGSFQSIHFAYDNLANSAQGARTLLTSPVTKSSSQTLRITYTFTFTP